MLLAMLAGFFSAPSLAKKNDDGLAEAATVFGSRQSRAAWQSAYLSGHETRRRLSVSLQPLVGATRYSGVANDYVQSGLATGLAVELEATPTFSVEVEGGYERASVAYRNFGHEFQRAQLGMNLKTYVTRGFFNPYVGAGFHGVRYGNMTYGPDAADPSPYDRWVGAAQATAGVELAFSDGFSLGARAAFTQPVANLPPMDFGGRVAGQEELALMRVGYLRFFGAAKISF